MLPQFQDPRRPLCEPLPKPGVERARTDPRDNCAPNPLRLPDAQANVRPGPDAELQHGGQFDGAGDHVLGGANAGAVPVQGYLHRAHLAARCMLTAWLLLDDGDGRAEVLLAEDLRCSTPEIARFFDLTLSRRRLAAVAAESAGWIESPLWSHLPAGDREFLLDVGLFGWVDGELLDEALERDGSIRRLKGMACRAGPLEPVRSRGARIYRLHPLIRDHCPTYRRRATPERYRSVQRLCASAARRDGVRHAPRTFTAWLPGS